MSHTSAHYSAIHIHVCMCSVYGICVCEYVPNVDKVNLISQIHHFKKPFGYDF
jgi:hypothetical protein